MGEFLGKTAQKAVAVELSFSVTKITAMVIM